MEILNRRYDAVIIGAGPAGSLADVRAITGIHFG